MRYYITLLFPVFFDNVIALIRNPDPSEKGRKTVIYLSDRRADYSAFTPKTLCKRYYTLFNNERGI